MGKQARRHGRAGRLPCSLTGQDVQAGAGGGVPHARRAVFGQRDSCAPILGQEHIVHSCGGTRGGEVGWVEGERAAGGAARGAHAASGSTQGAHRQAGRRVGRPAGMHTRGVAGGAVSLPPLLKRADTLSRLRQQTGRQAGRQAAWQKAGEQAVGTLMQLLHGLLRLPAVSQCCLRQQAPVCPLHADVAPKRKQKERKHGWLSCLQVDHNNCGVPLADDGSGEV